jgi:hypothetical protein
VAIAFRGSATATATNGGNTSLSLGSLADASGSSVSVQNGDFVVIVYTVASTADRAMSESTGTWTEQTELYADGSTQDANVAVYTKFWSTGDPTSVTLVGSGQAADSTAAVCIAFSGVNTATPLDVAIQTATGTGTGRPNAPSITPSTAGAWIVVCGGSAHIGGVAPFTNPGDLSTTTNHFRSTGANDNNDVSVGIGLKTNWTSGAFDPSQWTGGSTGAGAAWCAVSLALRPTGNAYSMTADGGSYSVTGTASDLDRGYPIAADAGSYSLAGTAASFARTHIMSADGGSYSLTGSAAGFNKGFHFDASQGVLPNSEFTNGLSGWSTSGTGTATWNAGKADLSNPPSAGAFKFGRAETGNVSPGTIYVATVEVTAISNTSNRWSFAGGDSFGNIGNDSFGFITATGRKVGLVSPSGTDYGLGVSTIWDNVTISVDSIDLSPLTYLVTGADIAFGSTAYDLVASEGGYFYAGTAAQLKKGLRVGADAGSYSYAGSAANLVTARKVTADSGSYAITGSSANFPVIRRIEANNGSYTLTGTDATIGSAGILQAEGGNYSLAGSALDLLAGFALTANAGAYGYTGFAASLLSTRLLEAAGGSYSLAGTDATLAWVRHLRLIAESGLYNLTGTAAGLLYGLWQVQLAPTPPWGGTDPNGSTWTVTSPNGSSWGNGSGTDPLWTVQPTSPSGWTNQ